MREAVARVDLYESADAPPPVEREEVLAEVDTLRPVAVWNPESYGRQQIQGLVRQVFFSDSERPIRQVVFSATDPETNVRAICRRVGEAVALETSRPVAVMGECPRLVQDGDGQIPGDGFRQGTVPPLRRIATRVRGNLWLVPGAGRPGDPVPNTVLRSYLGEMRREFEYSIVEGPAAGESDEAMAMAQFADGIVLVLSAQRTRRVTARKIKDALDGVHAHLLGTVLSDREFPIPEGIYRRL